MDELSKYNQLFQKMMAIVSELKSRPGDGRHALFVLHHHPNAQVRLASAHATVPIERAQSRAVFEQLIRAKEFPQAGDAGMAMRRLDDGSYGKPWVEPMAG